MKFDVSKSKLFGPIMEALVGFFSLDAETATETDIHAAIDGAKPLTEQLEEARAAAIADIKAQVDTLTGEVETMKTQVADLTKRAEAAEADLEVKENRISELQVEAAEAVKSLETLKGQHKKETDKLAGTIATLKAGKTLESGVDENHPVTKTEKTGGTEVVVVQSKALKDLVKRQGQN